MKRTRLLTTRVNDAELELIRQAAQAQGRATTNFVRFHALEAAKLASAKLANGGQGGAHA